MSAEHVYVIAEAGVNHNGDLALAFKLVDAAVNAGADAIKFQTFQADKLALKHVAKTAYQMLNTGIDENQLGMLKKLELPYSWHHELKQHCKSQGIEFLSTAFDIDSLNFLVALGLPVLKIPSGELTNGPLLWHFSRAGLPLILSTGMANLGEVEEALAVIQYGFDHESEPRDLSAVMRHWSVAGDHTALKDQVTLLHCTSQYPTPLQEVNLRSMDVLSAAFGLKVGYSDHTEGIFISLAAVARGATIIEKHLTLDRAMPGPDHKASLEPSEFKLMVEQIRGLEIAIGGGGKMPQISELDTRLTIRQYVVAARPLATGAILSRNDLTTLRSGGGLAPTELWGLVGRRVNRALDIGDVIKEGDTI